MATETFEAQLAECRRVAILEGRRRGLSADDAEDVAQEVSVKLWKALSSGQEIKSIGAWARVAAGRIIINDHRDAQRLKRGGGLIDSLNEMEEAGFEI